MPDVDRHFAHRPRNERDQHATAATNRTVDADRARVLELLQRLQRFVAGGGVRMWDGVDEHQAHADLQYAADAVARFPAAGGPPPPAQRLALDLQDFGALVRGHEVQRPGLRVILHDIGWPLMLDEINNAALEAGRRAAAAGEEGSRG